jgi:ATP/maltotriose-dependent transcriptional regulator MalT
MLLELERSNLFVIPLDGERPRFRYHHLFRSLLVRQLERFAPDAVADLHRRASSWFADEGDVR